MPIDFQPPPLAAAWRHRDAREGFETVFFAPAGDGWAVSGHSCAVEGGVAWSVRYEIAVDERWRTRSAVIAGRSAAGARERVLAGDGDGGWTVDGTPVPELDGCLEVDLEASAFTNTFPVRRLQLEVGDAAQAPAAYVRAVGLEVQRLEQRYERLPGDSRFDYRSPAFDFHCRLEYDASAMVLEYPGIAVRVPVAPAGLGGSP